jgi:hypothetical protein
MVRIRRHERRATHAWLEAQSNATLYVMEGRCRSGVLCPALAATPAAAVCVGYTDVVHNTTCLIPTCLQKPVIRDANPGCSLPWFLHARSVSAKDRTCPSHHWRHKSLRSRRRSRLALATSANASRLLNRSAAFIETNFALVNIANGGRSDFYAPNLTSKRGPGLDLCELGGFGR